MRHPRVTAIRFYEAAHVRGESSAESLAAHITKRVRQTESMKRGLELEPEVFASICQDVQHERVTLWPRRLF